MQAGPEPACIGSEALVADIYVAMRSDVSSGQLGVVDACRQVDVGNTTKVAASHRQGSHASTEDTAFAITTRTASATRTANTTRTASRIHSTAGTGSGTCSTVTCQGIGVAASTRCTGTIATVTGVTASACG